MAVFFATSAATHLSPKQFFGFAFWIGFSINVVAAELWLLSRQHLSMSTRPPALQVEEPSGKATASSLAGSSSSERGQVNP
jgi:hypothetical protein